MSKGKIFKSQAQPVLFECYSSIEEQVPNDQRMLLLSDIVDRLDISSVVASYQGGGSTAYHPRPMLKAIFFAYLNNCFSCRKIEDMIKWDKRCQWLCGGYKPSYQTINRFRNNRFGADVNGLFGRVLAQLVEMGLVDIATVYVDGTTMEARASRKELVWKNSVSRYAKGNTDKIREIIAQINAITQSEKDAMLEACDGEAITDEAISQLRQSLAAVNAAAGGGSGAEAAPMSRAERADRTRLSELDRRLDKAEDYNTTLEQIGDSRSSMAKTDHDATGMHSKDDHMRKGPCKAMYNLQIATASQFVLGFDLFSLVADTKTLPPFASKLAGTLSPIDPTRHGVKTMVADSAYGCLDNYDALAALHIEGCLKYSGYDNPNTDPFNIENMSYDPQADEYTCPEGRKLRHTADSKDGVVAHYECPSCQGCPLIDKCFKRTEEKPNRASDVNRRWREMKPKVKRRLDSPDWQELLARRSIEPEPVFGQTEANKQYYRFRHFRKDRILIDLALFFIAHNIAKAFALGNWDFLRLFLRLILTPHGHQGRPQSPFLHSDLQKHPWRMRPAA